MAAAAVASPPDGDDIIADLIYRLAQRVELPALVVLEIETEIRQDYRGERCYIAAQRGDFRAYLANRNQLVLRDHRAGESDYLLARRYGVTLRRIRQILAPYRAAPK